MTTVVADLQPGIGHLLNTSDVVPHLLDGFGGDTTRAFGFHMFWKKALSLGSSGISEHAKAKAITVSSL